MQIFIWKRIVYEIVVCEQGYHNPGSGTTCYTGGVHYCSELYNKILDVNT